MNIFFTQTITNLSELYIILWGVFMKKNMHLMKEKMQFGMWVR